MTRGRESRPDLGIGAAQKVRAATSLQAYARPAGSAGGSLDSAIDHATGDWWGTGAQRALAELAQSGRGFTADDLLDRVGQPPSSECTGAAFAAARRSKIIESLGARIGRDGRALKIWWGVKR